HRADALDGEVEPARDFPAGGFERTPSSGLGIELLREFRAVGTERLDLRGQRVDAAIGVAPPLGRRLKRIERSDQPARRRLDRAGTDRVRHVAFRHGVWSAHLSLSPIRPAPRATCMRLWASAFPGPAYVAPVRRPSPEIVLCCFVAISSRATSTCTQKFAPQF